MIARFLLSFLFLIYFLPTSAQWSNRYPKVAGHGHHVYLEAFELPIMNAGPMDPAPAPDNRALAFSSKGWLWLLDLQTMKATRITKSAAMDSRPEWSPDGSKLVFVRDDGKDTQIILLDLVSNTETILIDEIAIDLDPSFSLDMESVYYASAVNGSIDLWSIELETGIKRQITRGDSEPTRIGGIQQFPIFGENARIRRRPIVLPGEDRIIYLDKTGHFYNTIVLRDLTQNTDHVLAEEYITSQADFDINSDGSLIAYTWPNNHDYEIRLMSLNNPGPSLSVTAGEGLPLAPAFSADDQWVYFAEAGKNERTQLKRVLVSGGSPETIAIKSWDWNVPKGTIILTTKVDGVAQPVRLNVVDGTGHPVIPDSGTVRSEGQNGMIFYYSDGKIQLEAPSGELTITAVQGFLTQKVQKNVTVLPDEILEVTIELTRIWDPNASGWYSGDNHFHLNYGGTYQLDPEDIELDMKGEALDVGFPLLANLYFRFLQQDLWGWENIGMPLIRFGQEVRSHFLGHISLLAAKELYWPWIWGPYYDIYNTDDRTNAEPLRKAHEEGGLGGYVHPLSSRDPFSDDGARSVPVGLVADCVLGEADILEVVCLWSEEIGTAALWHEILNIGVPLAASAGSDVMNDYYRTMAVGATRVFVKPNGHLTEETYLDALKRGRSFVSNGPMLEFLVEEKEPGEIIETTSKKIKWSLNTHSALPFQNVEIIVNGSVVWSKAAKQQAGSQTFKGSLTLPPGGWVTARVHGGDISWPFMDSYPFAETSPIWFGSVGSTDPEVAKQAAMKLLKVLTVSRETLNKGYGDNAIPNLLQHFDKAARRLEEIIDQQDVE